MNRVSLRAIARKAGVSVPTVSLALRGKGTISKQRAAEIRALADAMGYRPNPLLASLASRRFSAAKSLQGTPIAIFEFPPVPGAPPAGASLYESPLLEAARNLGYAPTVFQWPTEETPARLYRQLYSRMTQGIIVTGSADLRTFGQEFDWSGFSVVQCARYLIDSPFHTVRPNIFQAVKLAFTQLLERGYRRIGFAVGRHAIILEDDEDRHGTAIALEMAHLRKPDRVPVYVGSIHDREAFQRWYRTHKPDVVVGFTAAHYWFLRELGLQIPRDVGFVALHTTPTDQSVSYAGLNQNVAEIARQSVFLLDQLIRQHECGTVEHPIQVLIPSTWIEGQTIRPAAPQSFDRV